MLLLVVVAGWAAYLLPLWCHRYDAASEMRSIHGFSTAMRTLTRRETTRAEGHHAMTSHPTEATARATPGAVNVTGGGVRRRVERRLARKRLLLLGLLTAFALSIPLALLAGGRTRLVPSAALSAVALYAAALRRARVSELARRRLSRKAALQRRVEEERRAYVERTAVPLGRPLRQVAAPRTRPPAYDDADDVGEHRQAVGG